ncbi:SMI1/KNR4 family protein [Alkalihalobacillus sp. R86527]|uniref:SMI1/KNR4 family protein n=1 Tax=Alkalihalobacillus sp. R86527 TaxID=3093863 RepID=UPI00366EAEC0
MSLCRFLSSYISCEDDKLSIKDHKFYNLEEPTIKSAEGRMGIQLPDELKTFYNEIGYGFINRGSSAINRLIDPESVADIRLKEDVYEFDPDLDIYTDSNKLVFFEAVEGLYLSISLSNRGTSPIYYIDTKIADSLEEFLRKIDEEEDYFYNLI